LELSDSARRSAIAPQQTVSSNKAYFIAGFLLSAGVQKLVNRLDKQIGLIDKGHVPTFRHYRQFRAADLLLHGPRERRIALVMIANHN
jgi:hypothetical protein